MRRPNPLVLEALDTLKAHGVTPRVIESRHFKITWIDHGRTHLLVVSRSPSDHKTAVASRTLLRRLLRANGAGANHG